MNSPETKDLLGFFFHSSDSMQTFWSFYITVVLGLIAFFATVKNPSRFLAIIMTTAFIIFAFVNLDGIRDITNQRLVAAKQIKENSDQLANIYKATINPPKFWIVALVHSLLDISTIVTLWMLVSKRSNT